MEILILAALIGLIPATIAYNKGHSFFGWWIFGAAIFIVALPMALIVKSDKNTLEKRAISENDLRKCPHCAELIRREATVCHYCRNEVVPAPSSSTSSQYQASNGGEQFY
jgi:hypothetical protein